MADLTKVVSVKVNAVVGDAVKKLESVAGATKDVGKAAGEMQSGLDAASVAAGVFTGTLAADVVKAFGEAIAQVTSMIIDLGAQTQKTIAGFSAMKNYVGDATEAYRAFNDVGRNTNYDLNAVQEMGAQLLNMGYSAQNAAELIQLCADTAAGLNQGQAGAQQLVEVLSRIQSTGEMSSRQLISLQMAGMDLDKAFSSVGMSAEQAMKAMDEGTMDAQTAIKALTEYMHEFDGSMEKSKNNITDQWGDVCGNMQTIMGEIGAAIFDAFNQSEIVQDLIDFTQDLLDMVRSDGTGAFSDLREVAAGALDIIEAGLKAVLQAVKLVIVGVSKMYAAFRSVGAKIASALSPILAPLSKIWGYVKSLLSSLGQSVSEYVNAEWGAMFGGAAETKSDTENHFRQLIRENKADKKKSGGRSGGGSRAKALTEEERAIEALIKKYSDADKARQKLAHTEIEIAKANLAMMTGEAKDMEEKRIKLQALENAHTEMLGGYEKELALAEKISNTEIRSSVIDEINRQIAAENKLYEAKVRVANFESNLKVNTKESKNILDKYFGSEDELANKIRSIEEGVARVFKLADYNKASKDAGGAGVATSQEDMDLISKLLQTTPDALQQELDAKSQTLADFIEANKERIAEAGKTLKENLKETQNWADLTVRYATMVGDSMSSAMMDWITGAKSGKEALRDFVSNLLKTAAQLLTRWLSLFAIFSIVGDPRLAARNASAAVFGAYDGKVKLRAGGGYITGPGSSTSDSIPAMLSNGEYVIRAAAVRKIGLPTLNALNSGRYHFADGGYVGGKEIKPAAALGGNVTLQVQALDATDFDNFLNLRGGGERIKAAIYEAQRRFDFSLG